MCILLKCYRYNYCHESIVEVLPAVLLRKKSSVMSCWSLTKLFQTFQGVEVLRAYNRRKRLQIFVIP